MDRCPEQSELQERLAIYDRLYEFAIKFVEGGYSPYQVSAALGACSVMIASGSYSGEELFDVLGDLLNGYTGGVHDTMRDAITATGVS